MFCNTWTRGPLVQPLKGLVLVADFQVKGYFMKFRCACAKISGKVRNFGAFTILKFSKKKKNLKKFKFKVPPILSKPAALVGQLHD